MWNATARYVLLGGSIANAARYWQRVAPVRDNGRPARWNASQVRKALLNPAVLGLRVYNGEVQGPGTWPPITTPDLYYRVYDLLTSPGRRAVESAEPTTLLSGTARCGTCGVGLYRRNDGGRAYYRCQAGHAMRQMEWLDGLASDLAVLCLAATIRDAVEGTLGDEERVADADLEAAHAAVEEARTALKELLEALPSMRLKPADAAAMVAGYRAAVESAEKHVGELASQQRRSHDVTTARLRRAVSAFGDVSAFVGASMTSTFEEVASELWDAADLRTRRKWCREVLLVETVKATRPKSLDGIRLEPRQGWEWLGDFQPWWRQSDWPTPA
ncbi:recombinase family protein [Prauserella oleivorans]